MDWQFQLIEDYICICDLLQEIGSFRKSNNSKPMLSDEEVLTIYSVGIQRGFSKIKEIHRYAQDHLFSWFPQLNSYKQFVKRLNNLSHSLVEMCYAIFDSNNVYGEGQEVIDSMPIVLARQARSSRAKVAPDLAAKGYCAVKKEYYYGVKLHVVAKAYKVSPKNISHCLMTKASVHDITILKQINENLDSEELFADKAYCSKPLYETQRKLEKIIHTPVKKSRSKKTLSFWERFYSRSVSKVRQYIESVFSWLHARTNIAKASFIRSSKGLIRHVFGAVMIASTSVSRH
jgi:hypothetical protein